MHFPPVIFINDVFIIFRSINITFDCPSGELSIIIQIMNKTSEQNGLT